MHPGRYVEIHTEPITAAEVMKRNPRHCITRPDVFKCPWVLVRPESVLVPGKVFFIVPNHTIYKLLKAHEDRNRKASLDENQCKKEGVYNEKSSQTKSWAGMTPRNLLINNNSCFYPWKKNPRNHPQVKSWPEMNVQPSIKPRQKHTQEFPEKSTAEDMDISSSKGHNVHRDSNSDDIQLPQNHQLKSCLRNPDSSDRKLLGLRVAFVFSKKDGENPRRFTESQDCAGVMSW